MTTELTTHQKALADFMSQLSEKAYCAGWMADLEHVLWAAVLDGPRQYGHLAIDAEMISELNRLSSACGGWIIFEDHEGETWVSISKWKTMYDPAKVRG